MFEKLPLSIIVISILFFFHNAIRLNAMAKPDLSAHLLFPQSSPPNEVIDVVDLTNESSDIKLAMITLQGHINSGKKSKVYFLKDWQKEANNNTPTIFWLEYFKVKNYIKAYHKLPITNFLDKYKSCYDQVIIYDPKLPATINIATMIGAIEKGIVVSPNDVSRFSSGKQITDLRNKWPTNIAAYEWAFDNLWPKMNHNILACQHPTFTDHYLRDYLVRHKVFQFWVTGKNAENNSSSDYEKELEFAKKLFSITPANTPLIGWLGTDDKDHGLTEYFGVGLAGQYGKITVGNNWCINLSMISGIEIDIPGMIDKYNNKLDHSIPKLKNDKVYISFAIQESGDSPMYWEYAQKNVWSDPARGRLPIGWSVGVPVFELCPAILEWFYDNATENDHFYLCMSGTGYTHPYRDLFSKTQNPKAAWEKYLSITEYYATVSKIKQMGLYTDAWLDFDRKKHDNITLKFAEGLTGIDTLIPGMGRDGKITEKGNNYLIGKNDVLVSHVTTRWDSKNIGRNEKNIEWLVDEIQKNTPLHRPAFIFVHPVSWSYYPSDLEEVLSKLGNDYIAIAPKHFRPLFLEDGMNDK